MSPLIDASVATALIAPDPYDNNDNDNGNGNGNENENEKNKPAIGDNNDNDNDNTEQKQKHKQNVAAVAVAVAVAKKKVVVVSDDERFYAVDPTKLQQLRDEKPWAKAESAAAAPAAPAQQGSSSSASSSSASSSTNNNNNNNNKNRPVAKFFESISFSPSAVTKMMMHCQSGVEKGVLQGGNPIEVMGLMLGRPDPHKPSNLIVTDAFPLPIEGFETRVIADDQSVINHMISLGERLELSRNEKFMGWYHSHPFDLVLGPEESRSHCFLSQTDLSTQLQWQRAEDPHGNPFAAVVVDPLRSMHLGTPQLKAFRAYPPEYQSSIMNECPDGSIVTSEKLRLERWGSCWNRYYELNVEYYMSDASRSILGDLTQNYLWMKSFRRDGQDDDDDLDGVGAVGGSEAVKVSTLRDIATDARSAAIGSNSNINSGNAAIRGGGTSSSLIGFGGGGGGSGTAANIQPLVHKLRSTATKALTKQTARCVHAKVFAKLNLNNNNNNDLNNNNNNSNAAAAAESESSKNHHDDSDTDDIATTATN